LFYVELQHSGYCLWGFLNLAACGILSGEIISPLAWLVFCAVHDAWLTSQLLPGFPSNKELHNMCCSVVLNQQAGMAHAQLSETSSKIFGPLSSGSLCNSKRLTQALTRAQVDKEEHSLTSQNHGSSSSQYSAAIRAAQQALGAIWGLSEATSPIPAMHGSTQAWPLLQAAVNKVHGWPRTTTSTDIDVIVSPAWTTTPTT
jgi:hypothetical protein